MTSPLKLPSSPVSLRQRRLNVLVTVGSVLLCLVLSPSRIPGMELLGVAPNWMLIWVVAWSVKRTPSQGAIAGLVMGLLQDSITAPHPTHTLSLIVVGVLTARLQKQRYIQEDIISIALIVFGMAVVAETVMALQVSIDRLFSANSLYPSLGEIWQFHQRVALSSAILSSLWAPAVYYPLNRWWERYAPQDLTS
ncbi:rod shape-determining protein MreD [Pseudanabaena sp. FACHB-2040]|uniref:rod shape-determining protein MreD n=1 Tax=Pseudanabaena sp. FACHB-2040 TaxID=2692859 RepID=UPI001684866E|nr:rod shape-determining protein MreD [Pseudanabaena sp. FACHB-2040]MBD2260496.1 rod shape-determining protein MreD [Pseudanabaena sp. FACHB-2040]